MQKFKDILADLAKKSLLYTKNTAPKVAFMSMLFSASLSFIGINNQIAWGILAGIITMIPKIGSLLAILTLFTFALFKQISNHNTVILVVLLGINYYISMLMNKKTLLGCNVEFDCKIALLIGVISWLLLGPISVFFSLPMAIVFELIKSRKKTS